MDLNSVLGMYGYSFLRIPNTFHNSVIVIQLNDLL